MLCGLYLVPIEPTKMTEGNHYILSGSGVDVYEQHIVPGVMAPFARGLVEAARLQVGEQVLDVACGTGIVSRLAWPQIAMSGSIVGVDLSASMLDTARRVAADHRMPVKWEHGDAASLPLASKTVDVVLCQHGLQYFPNRAAALREMHRVLKPSGRTVINVWRPVHYNPGHAAFADALERHVSDAAAAERRAPFALSERSAPHNQPLNPPAASVARCTRVRYASARRLPQTLRL